LLGACFVLRAGARGLRVRLEAVAGRLAVLERVGGALPVRVDGAGHARGAARQAAGGSGRRARGAGGG